MHVCQFLTLFFTYRPVWQISLVSDENFYHIIRCVGFNLLEPILDVVVSVLFGAVIDENDSHCSFVVGLSDGAEALLPSGIPHL